MEITYYDFQGSTATLREAEIHQQSFDRMLDIAGKMINLSTFFSMQ